MNVRPMSEQQMHKEENEQAMKALDNLNAPGRTPEQIEAAKTRALADGLSPSKSSLPTGLVEAVIQDHGFTREQAEAELIAFGA